MSAYVIGEAEVLRPDEMKAYGLLVKAAIEKFGGRYLARGVKPIVLEGGPAHNTLIIEFADVATAQAWYDSPEYAAAKAERAGKSNLRLMIVGDHVKPAS